MTYGVKQKNDGLLGAGNRHIGGFAFVDPFPPVRDPLHKI